MLIVAKLHLLKLTNSFPISNIITPTFSVGVFVCVVANYFKSIIAIILFGEARLIGIYCNKTAIKTIAHNFVLLQNAYADRVATTY